MSTIPQVAIKIIKSQPYLAEALVEGLINISSLARKIQPQVEKEVGKTVKMGALVMALNRLTPKLEMNGDMQKNEISSNIGDIIVRSNLLGITYKNTDSLIEKHNKLLNHIGVNQECFYTMVQGVFKSNIVVSSILQDKIEEIFKGEEVITQVSDLSAITLKLPVNKDHVGLFYFILRNIAWAGVNVEEIISITNEFTIVVKDGDIDKTFSVLKNLGSN